MSVGPKGAAYQQEKGVRHEVVDAAATAKDLREKLEARKAELAEIAAAAEKAGDPSILASVRQETVLVEGGLARLGKGGLDAATLAKIAQLTTTDLETKYAAVRGDTTKGSVTVSPGGQVAVTAERAVATTDGGARQSFTESAAANLDIAGGTAQASYRSATEAEDGEGGTRFAETDDSAAVAVGDGISLTRDSSRSIGAKDEDGEVTSGLKESSQVRGGVVVKDGEIGGKWGRTDATEVTGNGNTVTTTTTADTTITDKAVEHSRSVEKKLARGDWSGGVKASGDGRLALEVSPVEGSDPPQYTLTFTARAGGSVGGSAERSPPEGGKGAQVKASAGVKAAGSAELTISRTLSAADAARYMDAADADKLAALPEFGRLARMQAGADAAADGALEGAGALASPSLGAEMADGDSVSLVLEGSLSGEVSAGIEKGGLGAGAEASRSSSLDRKVTVAREGAAVRIVVSFGDAQAASLGASGTVEGVTTTVKGSQAAASEAEVSFLLDPKAADYDALYTQIVGTLTREGLLALAQSAPMKAHVAAMRSDRSQSVGSAVSLEAGGVAMTLANDHGTSESITKEGGSLSGTTEGQSASGLDVKVKGLTAGSSARTDKVTVDVRADGDMTATLTTAVAETDPLRAAKDAVGALAGMGAGDVAQGAVAASPLARLEALLSATYADISGTNLSQADILTVAGRAGDKRKWGWCNPDYKTQDAWEDLRSSLVSPPVDPAEAAIDPDVARKLGIGRAFAAFMDSPYGANAAAALDNVLNRWGQGGGAGSFQVTDAAPVGEKFEWPSELAAERAKLDGLKAQIAKLGATLQPFVEAAGGLASAEKKVEPLYAGLSAVKAAVERSVDFQSEQARAGVLSALSKQRAEVKLVFAEFRAEHQAWQLAQQAGPPNPDAPEPPAIDPLREAAEARIAEITGLLAQNNARQVQMFAQARGMYVGEAAELLDEVHKLHLAWIEQIKDLRVNYKLAGTPAERWFVSAGPGQPRRMPFEPDVATLCRIYEEAFAKDSVHAAFLSDIQKVTRQWRDQAAKY